MKDSILNYQEKCQAYEACVYEQNKLADQLSVARDATDKAYNERVVAEKKMLDALKSADINAI